MEAGILKERKLLVVNFNTPSGKKYLITNELNMGMSNDKTSLKFAQINSFHPQPAIKRNSKLLTNLTSRLLNLMAKSMTSIFETMVRPNMLHMW